MILDYELLRVIWWLLLVVLLVGFAIMDGFDLGTAILLPFVARSDTQRRVVINTVGPVWEGNQVWLILGAGAIFAAFPLLYATVFSGFYIAMLAVLLALILRPVGFKFRSKMPGARWRNNWDWLLFVGGFVPSLIFGVALGNVMQGVPFELDSQLLPIYRGSFWGLLNPFALLCGLLAVVMLAMHGGAYLVTKTGGLVQQRARRFSQVACIATITLFLFAGYFILNSISGFILISALDTGAPSNPLAKSIELAGHWSDNYGPLGKEPILPLLALSSLAIYLLLSVTRYEKPAFFFSASSIGLIVLTCAFALFPFMLPSSINPDHSLLIFDASSSQLTLFIMLVAACIFMPLIIAYTSWVYRVLRGKVDEEHLEHDNSY